MIRQCKFDIRNSNSIKGLAGVDLQVNVMGSSTNLAKSLFQSDTPFVLQRKSVSVGYKSGAAEPCARQ
jgi:hypothetical protein